MLKFHSRKKGFVLVVILGLLMFLVLLLVSLSFFLRTEIHSSENSVAMMRARQNALTGLTEAVGELQRLAGPDRRITGAADLQRKDDLDGSGNPIRTAGHAWTGVWQPPAADQPKAASTFLGWLTSYTRGSARPEPSQVRDTDTLQAGWVWLLRNRVSASDTDSIQVPVTLIGDATSPTGGFAWWAADEGVKMSLQTGGGAGGTLPAQADPWRVPASEGFPLVEELKDIAQPAQLRKVLGTSDAGLLDKAGGGKVDTAQIPGFFHSFTASSKSVLSDTLAGGLRKDLTAAFALSDSAFQSDFVSETGSLLFQPYANAGARWSLLRDFANFRANADRSVTVRASATERHGFFPVILDFQFYAGVSLRQDGVSGGQRIMRPYLYYFPAVVLWNPYDVTLKPPPGGYEVVFRIIVDNGTTWFSYVAGNYAGGVWQDYPLFGSTSREGRFPNFTSNNTNRDVRFRLLDSPDIPPGEAIVFSPEAHAQYQYTTATSGLPLKPGRPRGYGFWQRADNAFLEPQNATGTLVDLRRYPGVTSNAYLSANLILKTVSGEFLQHIRGPFLAHALNRPLVAAGSAIDSDAWAPDPFEPEGDLSGGAPFDYISGTFPFGLEITLTLPRLKRDLVQPSRLENRYVAHYNFRAPVLGKIDLNNIGFPNSGDCPIYDGFAFATYKPNGIFLNDLFQIDVWDGDRKAYVGRSDTASEGQQRTVYFHVPQTDSPPLSVADFSQADLQGHNFSQHPDGVFDPAVDIGSNLYRDGNHGPGHAVGESIADWRIASFAEYSQASNTPSLSVYDTAWLANRRLWDGFFFSNVPASGNITLPLANPRIAPWTGVVPEGAEAAKWRDYRTAARYLALDGGFNVNSTSVEAWLALLSDAFGIRAPAQDGSRVGQDDRAVVSTLPFLSGSALDDATGTESDSHTGGRMLSAQKLRTIAENLVLEVRKRGPFASVADFVNRALVTSEPAFSENGSGLPANAGLADLARDPRMMGALQAAIERSGVNDGYDADFFTKERTLQLEPEKNSRPPNQPAAMGAQLAGTPGYVSQASFLQRIGSVLTARSDTFLVRVYGEDRNAHTGKITARAFGEAIIQRKPEYLSEVDDPEIFPPTDPLNERFGRRFEIISFRWLDEDEV